MNTKHPHFEGRPILIGDKVKFKISGDDAKYKWQKVEAIIKEHPGLMDSEVDFPAYVQADRFEVFMHESEAKRYGYDPEVTGYITKHKPAPQS